MNDYRDERDEDREMAELLGGLPRDAELPGDLWPGIQARLQPRSGEASVVSLEERRDRGAAAGGATGGGRVRRTVSLSVGQLLAAGIVLAAVSGTTVWTALEAGNSGGSGPAVAATDPAVEAIPAILASQAYEDYDTAVGELEAIVAEGRQVLDPRTVLILEESLAEIDEAIRDAREALERDPASRALNRSLADNMKKKLGVLRYAAGIIQSVT